MIIDGSTLADTAPLVSSDLIYVGVDKGKAVWKGDKRAWHPWIGPGRPSHVPFLRGDGLPPRKPSGCGVDGECRLSLSTVAGAPLGDAPPLSYSFLFC